MRIIVGGSAHRELRDLVRGALGSLHDCRPVDILIHGGLGEVCAAAEDRARHVGVPVMPCPPDWIRHGKAAEAVRDLFMAADTRADLIVLFRRPAPTGPEPASARRRAPDPRGAGRDREMTRGLRPARVPEMQGHSQATVD